MNQQAKPARTYGTNDIASLYSRFPGAATLGTYQEIQRELAAKAGLGRWPLLAEIQGIQGGPESGSDTGIGSGSGVGPATGGGHAAAGPGR